MILASAMATKSSSDFQYFRNLENTHLQLTYLQLTFLIIGE